MNGILLVYHRRLSYESIVDTVTSNKLLDDVVVSFLDLQCIKYTLVEWDIQLNSLPAFSLNHTCTHNAVLIYTR